MSALVISLDFEMFWGVTDSKSIQNYGKNIEGVWHAVPAMLELFKKYEIHVTWATVGMLMCKNYNQWRDMCPSVLPKYKRKSLSAYTFASLARDFPKLFFARTLVEKIMAVENQEIGSHTYSHFYCGEEHGSINDFIQDINSNKIIFEEMGVKPTSFVFPRNQVCEDYLSELSTHGFTAYRGNQPHWLHRKGSSSSSNIFGRYLRFADDYIPISVNHVTKIKSSVCNRGLVNVSANRFLRPTKGFNIFDILNVKRIKTGMLKSAMMDSVFHLWWHPHNFGIHTETNLKNLELILKYYKFLNQKYGMISLSMQEVSQRKCLT